MDYVVECLFVFLCGGFFVGDDVVVDCVDCEGVVIMECCECVEFGGFYFYVEDVVLYERFCEFGVGVVELVV